jgi:hypothetical protein
MTSKKLTMKERNFVFHQTMDLRFILDVLKAAYAQDANENVLLAMTMIQSKIDGVRASEKAYYEQDIEDTWAMLGALPHAVRTWFIEYRESELAQ